MTIYDYFWLCMTLYDYLQLTAIYDYLGLCMTVMNIYDDVRLRMSKYVLLCLCFYDCIWLKYDNVWQYMTMYDLCLCMTVYDYVQQRMTKYDFVWLPITVLLYHSIFLYMTLYSIPLIDFPTSPDIFFIFVYLCLPLLTFVHLCSYHPSMHKFCTYLLPSSAKLKLKLTELSVTLFSFNPPGIKKNRA